jgi:hypothetical protein
MIKRISRSAAQAFDAAGPSGLAYLTSSLAMINPVIVRPMQAKSFENDIFVRYGGGYAEFLNQWALNISTAGGNDLGTSGTNNTDIPNVNADLQMGTWRAHLWRQAFTIQYADLERIKLANDSGLAPPISLQSVYEEVIDAAYLKFMDRVVYLGRNSTEPGIINNSAVTATTISASWTSDGKTPVQMLADLNSLIDDVVSNSGYAFQDALPNRQLVPWSTFTALSQPMTTAGSISVKRYLEENCTSTLKGVPLTIDALPDPWIAGQGVGATNRTLVYRNDPQCLDMFVPQPPRLVMTVPSVDSGVGYKSVFEANIGQVRWVRPQTAVYGDGI